MRDFTFGFKLCLNKEQPIKYRQQEFYKKINNELVKIPNKKNKNIPEIFTWRIYRMKHINEEYENCSFDKPTNDIGSGLTDEWILLNLNSNKVFDFNYIPQNNDNLIIETNEFFSPYISFIFENDKWRIGYHIPFEYEIEEIFKGKVVEK